MVVNPDSGITTNRYDSANRKTSSTDPEGNITTYTYDDIGNLISMIDPEGGECTFTYDSDGNLISETNPLGNTTSYEYDKMGRKIKITDPSGGEINCIYNAGGQKVIETDQLENETKYIYDKLGRPIEVIDKMGNSMCKSYDNEGNLTSLTNAEGHKETYIYDKCNRLLVSLDPLGNATTYSYDNNGNELSVEDPLGNTVNRTYDFAGRVITTTDAEGNTITITYDACGNMISETDPAGNITTYSYDEMNRLLSTTDPEGRFCSYEYDLNGKKISETDGEGNTTSYTYNGLGLMESATDPLGNTVTYSYNQAGCRTSMINPKGAVISYVYDEMGRLVSETNPLSETTTYTYDEIGRNTAISDGEGTSIFSYDQEDNLVYAEYPGAVVETLEYDKNNMPVKLSNSETTISVDYDSMGRPVSSSNGAATINAVYDEASRMVNKTMTYIGGTKSFDYSYNGSNQLTSIIDENGQTTLAYNLTGRLNNKVYPNGVSTQYGYDKGGVLSSIEVNNGEKQVKLYQISRDLRGNITEILEDGVSNIEYTYDSASRIISEVIPCTGDAAYTYDQTGNRLTVEEEGEPVITFYYNSGDQLTNDSAGNNYSYNQRGDLVKITNGSYERDYNWDGKGRLISIKDNDATTVAYNYDALDRVVASNENLNTTISLYDLAGDSEIATFDENYDLKSIINAGTYGLVSITENGVESYMLFDPCSNMSLSTDEAGVVTEVLHFNSWGNIAEQTEMPYVFKGQDQKKTYHSFGLVKMGMRYYDPELGRFISRDELKGVDELPISRNPYVYAYNDPVNISDLTGLSPELDHKRSVSNGFLSPLADRGIMKLMLASTPPDQTQQSVVCIPTKNVDDKEHQQLNPSRPSLIRPPRKKGVEVDVCSDDCPPLLEYQHSIVEDKFELPGLPRSKETKKVLTLGKKYGPEVIKPGCKAGLKALDLYGWSQKGATAGDLAYFFTHFKDIQAWGYNIVDAWWYHSDRWFYNYAYEAGEVSTWINYDFYCYKKFNQFLRQLTAGKGVDLYNMLPKGTPSL